jgi:hypothetical protein
MTQYLVTTKQEVLVTFESDEANEDQAKYIAQQVACWGRLTEGSTRTLGRFSAKSMTPEILDAVPFKSKL